MLIAACYGQGETEYATANSLVAAFRNLGHEVLRVGPDYVYPDTPPRPWGNGADVLLDDRPFPETYTYDEVLAKTGKVNLLLQIEPHFYLHGEKPKGVKSAYYFTDPHRGGWAYYNLAKEGSFDVVFCGQPGFVSLFQGLNCPVFPVPPAFDIRRKVEYSEKTECDISFCGQTGLANIDYHKTDEFGQYATHLPDWNKSSNFSFPGPGWDYAERAAMLSLLCKDFNVRVYRGGMVGDNYMKSIQTGKIGFNRSLLGDIGIRCFEVMAAGRALVTDSLDQYTLPYNCTHIYKTYFKPFFDNFLLEYEVVRKEIASMLTGNYWKHMGELAYERTFREHLWEHRAEQMLRHVAIS